MAPPARPAELARPVRRAARKAELFTSVLDNGGVFSGSLDADDIRALFA